MEVNRIEINVINDVRKNTARKIERNRKIVYGLLIAFLVLDVISTFIGIAYAGLSERNPIINMFTNFWFTLIATHITAIVLVMLSYKVSTYEKSNNKMAMSILAVYALAITWNFTVIILRLAGWY